MADAREELATAQLIYERRLSVADDTDSLKSGDIIAIRRSGREYAETVVRYSNAVMAWLALVDRSR
jgi:hypothetical protein